jgi:hypothetical protein
VHSGSLREAICKMTAYLIDSKERAWGGNMKMNSYVVSVSYSLRSLVLEVLNLRFVSTEGVL